MDCPFFVLPMKHVRHIGIMTHSVSACPGITFLVPNQLLLKGCINIINVLRRVRHHKNRSSSNLEVIHKVWLSNCSFFFTLVQANAKTVLAFL